MDLGGRWLRLALGPGREIHDLHDAHVGVAAIWAEAVDDPAERAPWMEVGEEVVVVAVDQLGVAVDVDAVADHRAHGLAGGVGGELAALEDLVAVGVETAV